MIVDEKKHISKMVEKSFSYQDRRHQHNQTLSVFCKRDFANA